ncbi:cytochrome P450 monooxygenase CYP539B5 [Xylariaceae sp. FL0804]|nr:cytochrome P450 monooxygenase CYP539B5 [Xylariaceae sp. FL0804]
MAVNFGFPSSTWLKYGLLFFAASIAYYITQYIRREAAIRRLGGQRAHILYRNPLSAIYYTALFMKYSSRNKTFELYEKLYSSLPPTSRNVWEVQPVPSFRNIETREPQHALLAGQFTDFGKGPGFHKDWSPFLGDSIFTTDGKVWQHSRALIRPLFMTDRISDLYTFERGIAKFMSLLPPSGQTVEISDLFFRMTLDVTTEFLLGESVNSLDNPHGDFTFAFNEVLVQQIRIFILRIFNPLDKLAWGTRREYRRHIKTIEDFLYPIIQRTLAISADELEKLTKSDDEFTFLHNLARSNRDPKFIRDQLVAVLLAGRDTTAATLSWAFYELAAHPDKVARLRAEVLRTVGRHGAPTYAHLKDMRYLRYALQETLRLHPAVPFNIKEALADTTLPATDGSPAISVCRGDSVCFSPLTLHRRPDLYPPTTEAFADPATFSPERWYVWQPRPFEYIPFNGGPRICPGQNFAMTEMQYTMVRMLQKYDRFEYRGDWHAQLDQTAVISRPALGVPIALHEARD